MWPRMLPSGYNNRIETLGSEMMCQCTWMSGWRPCLLTTTQGLLPLYMADLFMSTTSTVYMAAASTPGLIEPPSLSQDSSLQFTVLFCPCLGYSKVSQPNGWWGFSTHVQLERHNGCQTSVLKRNSDWSQNNKLGMSLWLVLESRSATTQKDGAWKTKNNKGNLNSQMDFWEV